jgi:hypothetical protein
MLYSDAFRIISLTIFFGYFLADTYSPSNILFMEENTVSAIHLWGYYISTNIISPEYPRTKLRKFHAQNIHSGDTGDSGDIIHTSLLNSLQEI